MQLANDGVDWAFRSAFKLSIVLVPIALLSDFAIRDTHKPPQLPMEMFPGLKDGIESDGKLDKWTRN